MTDLHRLYELQQRLSEFEVYHPAEVEAFDEARDAAEIARRLGPVIDRYLELYDPAKKEFLRVLSAFVELYLASPQPPVSTDPFLQKLHTFARSLLPRLPAPPEPEKLEVAEEVVLYRSTSEAKEIDLLRDIRRALPSGVADRYRALMGKRRAETLTETEHAELIRLTDESERLQAERIESLAELAHLRRISLAALAEDLSFQPRLNA
jgi:hypothetical protein